MVTQSIPLLDSIPARERARTASVCSRQSILKGQRIFEEGQPVDAVWFVVRGCVYLVKRMSPKTAVTVFILTPEESICGISALGYPTYAVGAVAATDAVMMRIPRQIFLRWIKAYPAFAVAMLSRSCARLRHMSEAVAIAHAPVEQRLAYVLLRLRKSFGSTIPMTHQELAQLAGTRWETSIRTLARMRQRGWVQTGRGRITVAQPQALTTTAYAGLVTNGIPFESALV